MCLEIFEAVATTCLIVIGIMLTALGVLEIGKRIIKCVIELIYEKWR